MPDQAGRMNRPLLSFNHEIDPRIQNEESWIHNPKSTILHSFFIDYGGYVLRFAPGGFARLC